MSKSMNKIDKTCIEIFNNYDLVPIKDFFEKNKPFTLTVNCITYNHKNYIRKCLDSILNQKVNFNVLINIHDDASTDGTKEILQEYKNKYPNIINLILETENQYKKDKTVIAQKLAANFKGKYLAVCEGDDYWDDVYKLATQFYFMEANPDCHFCVHKTKVINIKDNTKFFYPNYSLKSKILSSKKFIKFINEKYSFQTSSYFRRGDDYLNFVNNKPKFSELMPNGDEANLLYYGSLGNAIYINREMSVYNKFTESSWTNTSLKYSKEDRIKREKRICESLLAFDEFSNHKYHSSVMKRYYGLIYAISKQENNTKEIFITNKKFRHYILLHRFWLYCYCVLNIFCKNKLYY